MLATEQVSLHPSNDDEQAEAQTGGERTKKQRRKPALPPARAERALEGRRVRQAVSHSSDHHVHLLHRVAGCSFAEQSRKVLPRLCIACVSLCGTYPGRGLSTFRVGLHCCGLP